MRILKQLIKTKLMLTSVWKNVAEAKLEGSFVRYCLLSMATIIAALHINLLHAAQFTSKPLQGDLQRSDGSIAAKPVYQGDYYHSASGEVIKVYRKQGVFVLPRESQQQNRTLEAQLNRLPNFARATKHNLPGADVLRVTSKPLSFTSSKKAVSTMQADVNALQASLPQMRPVFTTEHGLGDLMLLPAVTVDLESGADINAVLKTLEKRFKLSLVRKLNVSGNVFSLKFTRAFADPSDQFAAVRAASSVAGVNWAEPQFYMQAQKTQFTPTDGLYSQQWNLNNTGYRGSRCDADCDALNAWRTGNGSGPATGAGMIIAVIDDGVQTDHPDLTIAAGGSDFVDDTNTFCGDDGDPGLDSDPNPSPVINCVEAGDDIQPDNHGTAVAGIAAGKQDGTGVVGTAFNASILPIRAISEYDIADINVSPPCDRLADAIEYAAQRADVLNLSWSLPVECSALTQAIVRTTRGEVTEGTGSVVIASGNNASGWVKVTATVPPGEHAYEWRYLRSDAPDEDSTGIDNTVWIDDITWPNGDKEGFESLADFSSSDFTTDWVLNSCNSLCTFSFGDEPVWGINTNPDINYARTGNNAASLLASNSDCGNSYLHTLRDDGPGEISFWVWVSSNTQDGFDKFEFLIDGKEVISYGDLAAFGFVDNPVAYPASLSNDASLVPAEQGVIAVGASTSGDLSGDSSRAPLLEYRAPYSQFGPTLDVVAPSSDQHLGITTTDRFVSNYTPINGVQDSLGLNTANSANDINADRRYTQNFGGTSAAAPVVNDNGARARMCGSNI